MCKTIPQVPVCFQNSAVKLARGMIEGYVGINVGVFQIRCTYPSEGVRKFNIPVFNQP